ncbi:SPFH domain-containing protein [Echinimonas agarilytica]|uniref:SPFH/Band 7/PHB domain protein n=1 Tax=Echinimonas agarilytica TaxID=1215918 RepID=A0AA42B6E5_9GAMM|nr:SPFH domain-containing protein [Echinimonas agarilytica]MCM2678458.1 SPFH/Band 7/PHB domain protein [Echinimonas agarilytica]
MSGLPILPLVIVVFVLFIAFSGIVSVKQGFEYTIERFGKFTRSLKPGLHFIVPFVDRIGYKVNVMEQVLDIPSQEVISADNAMVNIDALLFFVPVDAAKSVYEVNHLHHALRNLAMTNIRTVLGSMELDRMLSERDEINSRLLHVVDTAAEPWGVKVVRIEIKDIAPPQDLVDAMANQMKAERDKRASILEAEGKRQAAILNAEGEKLSQILEAEGRKESAFRDAEAREREAQAEAEATRMVSEAIAAGNPQALNYFIAQSYVTSLEKMASADNHKVIMMPLEASGVLGAVEGVRELLQGMQK